MVPKAELENLVLEGEWNHVEVSFVLCYDTLFEDDCTSATTVKWCEIHVYKKKESRLSMEDIKFKNPNEECLPGWVLEFHKSSKHVMRTRKIKWSFDQFKLLFIFYYYSVFS